MRVLFLSQLVPYPPDSGAKVRSYYALRHLSGHHDVTLVCFRRADDSGEALDHLRTFCREVHTVPIARSTWKNTRYLLESLITSRSFIIARDASPEMDALLARIAGGFDIVHADQLWMAPFAARLDLPKLLDQHNAVYKIPARMAENESNPLKRWFLRYESGKLRRFEGEIMRRFDHVVAVTDVDRAELSRMMGAGGPPVTTIPICVDAEEMAAWEPGRSRNVVSVGTMFWPPNVRGIAWFVEHVWPLVRASAPDAHFIAAGKNPPGSLKAWEARDPTVSFPGYVPDIGPLLRDAAAFVVPLHAGGGMRVKIVDTWRAGVPMVSTTIGAEGIAAMHGENILIADSAADFAEAVLRLMRDPGLAAALSAGGQRAIMEKYDWRREYGRFDEVYGEVAS
jgi:glycosyltransferase involved in cell wall biosynthesis